MSTPVDLTNLHEITGHDAELEAELFAQFHEAFTTGIAGMEESIAAADTDTWRRHAHALKGVALNLGAESLGGICKTAQDESPAAADMSKLLASIRTEYQRVCHFLDQ